MVEVLVEEEVDAGLEVPAVGAVHAGAADGKIARRETARVAAGRLEVIVRYVRCDEAVPVAGARREARAGVRASRAIAVQVQGAIEDQLGLLGHREVQIDARGEELVVGEAAERVLERPRLVIPRHVHAEDGGRSPSVRAVEPETFFAADQVEVDQAAHGRVASRRDATCATRFARSRRLIDRRIPLVDAAPEADPLVQRPAPHLHADVTKAGKRVVGKAERVGLQSAVT